MKNNRRIGIDDIENYNKKKIRKKKDSIFNRFSTKENIIIFSFVLIFLIIISNFIKNYNPYSKINYNNINSTSFLIYSKIDHDRENYWIINDIILNFLYSHEQTPTTGNNGEGKEASLYYKYSTEEYYDALYDDYKTHLSKKEYLNLANKVIENYKQNYETINKVGVQLPIRNIYKITNLNGDFFIVRLNTSTESYIGIQLLKENSNFRIFYLE